MNFSENTNLMPGGQSASPSKVRELENRIDDLSQTVTSVADSVADLADEVTTAELNATSANVTNAVIDNATVGEETVTTVNAITVNADNLNATDADITNLTADDIEANDVDADNGYFGSVNAQSFTGQGVNITGDITASNKVQGKTVQATEKVVTPALESTQTELKGATTVRGDVYFPENGDKIYGEYLEVDANKVKVKSLTTETPTGSSQLVGYDENGELIPVDAGLDPANYWELVPGDQTSIQPKDNKKIEATEITTSKLNADDVNITDDLSVGGDATVTGTLSVTGDATVNGDTTLRDTEVDGDLTVNGDIIQNGSAYETHAEKVYSKNDLIITRDGAVSGLSTGQYTGIQATKYDGTNDGQLVFDKDGEARVGDVGDTEPLMTRDELADMTNGSLLKWDGTNKKAVCAQSADIIPSDASTSNKLATKDYVSTALAYQIATDCNACIPSAANKEEVFVLSNTASNLPSGESANQITFLLESKYSAGTTLGLFGIIQTLYCHSNPVREYVRRGYSTNNGTTWVWDNWTKYVNNVTSVKGNVGNAVFNGLSNHTYLIVIVHPYANAGLYTWVANGAYSVQTIIASGISTPPVFTVNGNELTIETNAEIEVFEIGSWA